MSVLAIAVAIFVAFVFLFVLALCRIAGAADSHIDDEGGSP